MYKMCDRCRFSVPAKQELCHVCGSHDFVSDDIKASKPLEESIQNCKQSFGGAVNKMHTALSALGKEIGETAHKAQRATDSMRKLIFEAGPNHDEVLSFHRSIGGGRNVQFMPVMPVKIDRANAIASSTSFNVADSEPILCGALTSDDNLYAPALDFVAYMEANSLPSLKSVKLEVAPVDFDAQAEAESFLAQLLGPIRDKQAIVVVAPAAAEVAEQVEDVDSLKKNIDELKGWFESYGKEGPLVKSDLIVAGSTDAAHEDTSAAESELGASRQAA